VISPPKGEYFGSLKPLWMTGGFHNAECAIIDHRTQAIYVSNMASDNSTDTTGRGFISRLAMDGRLLQERWIEGLNVPCGITVRGTRLYVVDADRLRVFDTTTVRQVEEYLAPAAVFLDGMAADEAGENIFVSDIGGCAIWHLQRNKWQKWLEDPRLDFPDGMVAESDRLVVGTYGLWEGCYVWKPGTTEDHIGHLIAVDYKTKAITDIGDGSPIAHHDGLTTDGKDGYITSDFVAATLIHVDRSGRTSLLAKYEPATSRLPAREDYVDMWKRYGCFCGPADLRYDVTTRILLVPFVDVGYVAAYEYHRGD
jgi:hypothetical protein